MKYSFLFILLMSFINLYSQFNDSKEYGFLGNLKKVTTYNYLDLDKNGNQWVIDEDKLVSIWEFIVDENQNFKEMKVTLISDGEKEINIYKYEFINSLKTSYNKYDEVGKIIEKGKFDWLNEKSYRAEFKFDNYVIDYLVILNDNFRDFIGENRVFEIFENEKFPVDITSYKNFFDTSGLIQKSETYDILGNIISTSYNEIHKIDEKGNMIEFAIIKDDGTLERFVKRIFEYAE